MSLRKTILQASLITWTKGFSAAGVEGKNVVTMLKEAIARRGVSIKKKLLLTLAM